MRTEIYDLRSHQEFNSTLRAIVSEISPTITITGEQLELVEVDRQLLLKVIPELLRNALAHSGASQIHLELSSSHDVVMVRVSDNGRGGATTTSGRYGLLGCIERVEKHGASINIDSREGGTTITIAL